MQGKYFVVEKFSRCKQSLKESFLENKRLDRGNILDLTHIHEGKSEGEFFIREQTLKEKNILQRNYSERINSMKVKHREILPW